MNSPTVADLGAKRSELVGTSSVSDATNNMSAARILIYGINYAPELIGVGRYTGDIGSYLVSEGDRVEVVTAAPHYPSWSVRPPFTNWYSRERSPGLKIYRCPLLVRKKMRGVWRILAPLTFACTSGPVAVWRILISRPTTVLCIEPTLFSAPLALAAAKLVGARTVLHVQDLEIDAAFAVGHVASGWLKVVATCFEAAILKSFDRVITISNRMRESLLSKGLGGERVVVIRNWVDTGKIKPLSGPNRFRQELGLPDQTFVALYAGSIGAKQALDVVLDAAERLVSERDFVFLIAGEGPERDGLIARGVQNVRFLPLQPEALLPELLAAADVHLLAQGRGATDLVLPSKLGGMLASGRQLVVQAYRGSELHCFLEDAATLVPPGDADALVDALKACARDADNRVEQRGLLAQKLSSAKILPDFRKVLVQ